MKIDIPKELKANVKVAHLNVRSLKSREHFSLVKDTIILNSFDVFTISETWLDATVNDANIENKGISSSDKIVDQINLEEVCVSMPSPTSRRQ